MLRFKPDDWLEGLLRPVILADPYGGIYYEQPAPDLRFAALLALTGVAVLVPRVRTGMTKPAWLALAGLWLMFYLWTFLTGNGRYFIAGLMLVGPLLVLITSLLPLTRAMRAFLLGGLLVLQGLLVQQHVSHGQWALAYWRQGPGLPLGDTPLRNEPAVFLTLASISHSLLVPQFHPDSRWANIAGQIDIEPGMPEYEPLRDLLAALMPRYLVMHVIDGAAGDARQPPADVREMAHATLARHGLSLDDRPCEVLASHLLIRDMSKDTDPSLPLGYWICPLRAGAAVAPTTTAAAPPDMHDDVFSLVERHCPRYFPPGSGNRRSAGEVTIRHYIGSDTRLFVDGHGNVLYRYMRAFNPTFVGTVEQVRRGEFAIDCRKLAGRYVYPWQRD